MLNAQKHAACGHIQVTVRREGERVEVEVCDDGCGFDGEDGRGARAGHFGLDLMRERAERLGGRLAIVSRPGGTSVRGTVLLRDYDADMGETG